MKKIIFLCHGNICRSPAAEFVAKEYLKKIGRQDEFEIDSLALSLEEIGNDIYPPMKQELYKRGIKFTHKSARRITKNEYENADYIFYMDYLNKTYLLRLFGNIRKNVLPIYFYTKNITEIEDPWYSDRYSLVVDQIYECIKDIFINI